MSLAEQLSARIKARREEMKLSVEEVAAGTGLGLERYQAIESGKTNITMGEVNIIAPQLCTRFELLFGASVSRGTAHVAK